MQFRGDNSAYGQEQVELSAERQVGVLVEEGEGFPFDACGLVPVHTSRRKKGGVKTVYALPFGAGEPDDSPLAREIGDALGFVNVLIDEACDLAGCDLAGIDALNIAIPEKGYNFTRVELTPLDDLGRPAYVPLHLRLETSETPNEPGSTSVVLDFDCDGRAYSVLINQFFEDGAALRVVAGRDDGRRDVYVQKVYDVPAPNAEPQEIYYRHHRPHWAQRKYGPDRDDRRW